MSWSARTDAETMRRRAAGRRRYNAWRRSVATYRRSQVAALLAAWGPLTPGVQRTIAATLRVSEATISRDVDWLRGYLRAGPIVRADVVGEGVAR